MRRVMNDTNILDDCEKALLYKAVWKMRMEKIIWTMTV
jgi:hypothetical protein